MKTIKDLLNETCNSIKSDCSEYMFQSLDILCEFVPDFFGPHGLLNQGTHPSINWKIDIEINIDRFGAGSPFSIISKPSYEIVGWKPAEEHQKLFDLVFGWFFDRVFATWKNKYFKVAPVGWSGNSIYGNFMVIKDNDREDNHQSLSNWHIRFGQEEKTIAVILVKNCDLSIKKVVESIARISDYQLILDDNSTDKTVDIVQSLYGFYPGLILRENILGMSASAGYIKPLLGTRSNIWKVDGDEFWAPKHVPAIRTILKSDEWKKSTDCVTERSRIDIFQIEQNSETAIGHLRDDVSLYNFANILHWRQPHERLHGEGMVRRKDCETLLIKGYDSLMAHFPFLSMSSVDVNQFCPDLLDYKKRTYSKNEKEKEIKINLIEFDCEEEIRKANT